MTVLLEGALRSSVVLALALLAMPLLRRRSASLRHCVLACAIAAAAVVAPLSWVVPHWTIQLPRGPAEVAPAPAAAFVASIAAAAQEDGPALELVSVVRWLWLLGAGIGVGALLGSLARLRRIAAGAVPITDSAWTRVTSEVARAAGLGRPPVVLQTETPHVLATWGVLHPRLLVPSHARGWSDARIRSVLRHEVAHIQRHDWLVQLAANALRALHWYNPLFWLACRRLRLESERACDDAVLRAGMPAHDYAWHLLEVARACRPSSMSVGAAIPMARPSTLRRRITAMLNSSLGHDPLSRRGVTLVALALIVVALAAAALRAAQEGPFPLTGFVYDPSGAVVPGAALTLEDQQQTTWQAISDSTGRFEFGPVPGGPYVLRVALPGFRALTQAIELAHERDWERAVTLQVGSVQETIVVRDQRLPASRTALAGPVRVRVGGSIRPPRKLRDVRPVYPESMREAGLEGVVPLEAIIGRTGTVQSVRVLTAAVHPDLVQAAIDAVRQWLFDPTLLNGEPVEVVMTVSVGFELED